MYERLASLPITHVLLKGSVVWPQSKQPGNGSIFPRGILQNEALHVARLPQELIRYKQYGQVLFTTLDENLYICYPNHETTHIYFPPWILFGFLNPDNKLTVPIYSYNRQKKEKKLVQGVLL